MSEPNQLKDEINGLKNELASLRRQSTVQLARLRDNDLRTSYLQSIITVVDSLISCENIEHLFNTALREAHKKFGLNRCGLYFQERQYIYATIGEIDQENNFRLSTESWEQDDIWRIRFRPYGPEETRWQTDNSTGLRPADKDVDKSAFRMIFYQIVNSRHRAVAVLGAKIPKTRYEDVNDEVKEFLKLYCSILGEVIETKQVEKRLRESELRLKSALNSSRNQVEEIASVHRRLLPARYEPMGGLEIVARCNPSADVGGDFYFSRELKDGRVLFCISDVSGHGAMAATTTSIAHALLSTALIEMKDREGPAAVIDRLNRWLTNEIGQEQFLTLWMGIFSPDDETLTYCSCAHPPAVLLKPGEKPSYLVQETGLPVGLSGVDVTIPKEQTIEFELGDRLILYTDGWTESPSYEGRLLSGDELLRFFGESEMQPIKQVIDILFMEFERHAANSVIRDDMTILIADRYM